VESLVPISDSGTALWDTVSHCFCVRAVRLIFHLRCREALVSLLLQRAVDFFEPICCCYFGVDEYCVRGVPAFVICAV